MAISVVKQFEKHWIKTHLHTYPSVRDRPRVFAKRARKSRNDICGT